MSKSACMASLAAILTLTGWAVPAGAAQSVQRTMPADAHGVVDIVNADGEVRILGWERDEVQISGDLGKGVDRLDVGSSNARISINVVAVRGRSGGSTDLTIRVPRESSLSVATISANQEIEGVRGPQRLQAVSGSITTEQWSEDVEARTISGSIELKGHGGDAEVVVSTVSGSIELTNASQELSVETVNGEMQIDAAKLDRARIRSTNGELRLTAMLMPSARLDIEAINGDLRLRLRRPVDARFDVETFNGDIENCFGPKPVRTREFAPGNALRFTEGVGNARVRVKTLNGGVDLCTE